MKKYLGILLFITSLSYSQEIINLENIAKYDGEVVTVCDTVQSTFKTKGDKKVVYLNFGKSYPNHTFTAVIFESSLSYFSYDPVAFLKGKTICITGKVTLYKGKPQMVLLNEKQLIIK